MDAGDIVFAEASVAPPIAAQPAGRLQVISDRAPELSIRSLGNSFEIDFVRLSDLGAAIPQLYVLVDIDLKNCDGLLELRRWLRGKPKFGKVLVAVDKTSGNHAHLQQIQARALGVTDIVTRPVDAAVVSKKLWGDFDSLAVGKLSDALKKSPVVAASVTTLRNILTSAAQGEAPDLQAVSSSCGAIVAQIEEKGLAAWVNTVREHHSQTYQHSLIVTAIAVGFGRILGASDADVHRLSVAGMLHDIGKAVVPVSILEKPAPLDESEMEIVRKHPEAGFETLKHAPGIHPDILDVVLSHHEYLDGTGYPGGLRANRIPDLVRLMTVADIFGALIEQRAYKPPFTGAAAYKILVDMGSKLDQDLVRAFRAVSEAIPTQRTS